MESLCCNCSAIVESMRLLECSSNPRFAVFLFLGMLLLEYVTLNSAEGVSYWNGLHYYNVPGENFPLTLY